MPKPMRTDKRLKFDEEAKLFRERLGIINNAVFGLHDSIHQYLVDHATLSEVVNLWSYITEELDEEEALEFLADIMQHNFDRAKIKTHYIPDTPNQYTNIDELIEYHRRVRVD